MTDGRDVQLHGLAGELIVSFSSDMSYPFGVTVQKAFEKAHHDGVDSLILDVYGVMFLDSKRITALVQCLHHADAVGMRFEVRNAPPNVARKLELVGLASLLPGE